MNAPDKVINLHDAADKMLRDGAAMDVAWRLKDGKEVSGTNLLGLLDTELDNRTITVDSLLDILLNYGERHLLAERLVDGIIERFLSTPKGRQALEEEMERPYEPDPADWQDN